MPQSISKAGTPEDGTVVKALRRLWRRAKRGQDRKSRASETECGQFYRGRRYISKRAAGTIGGSTVVHRHGTLHVVHLDWQHAMRWPPFNTEPLHPGLIVQMMTYLTTKRKLGRGPRRRRDRQRIQQAISAVNSLDGKSFWQDYMLPECPHLDRDWQPADIPPLSEKAAAVYEMLLELPPHRSMTGPALVDALSKRGLYTDQQTLTTHIIPKLKPYGIENARRVGYRIPASRRPPPC